MAGSVFDRCSSMSTRNSKNPGKTQYDINGITKPSVVYRGHRSQALPEEIVTEGDRQLQELLKKQVNTSVSLNQILKQKKEFSESSISWSVLSMEGGTMTPNTYNKFIEKDEEMERLRQAGLTEDEILLHLQVHLNDGSAKGSHFGSDPTAFNERLKEIERKLDRHRHQLQQPTKFSGAKALSRQEMDLENAITKNREKTKQLSCLIRDRSVGSNEHPSHPMNHLDEILEYISSRSKITAKRRVSDDDCIGLKKCKKGSSEDDRKTEEFDSEEEETVRENFDVPNRPEGHRDPAMIHLPDGSRAIEGDVKDIPEGVIRRFRLGLKEIQQIPRFRDYTPGEPSSTIYLKNLSSQVVESDLVALFNRFQRPEEPKIVFRLLKGRMKGQAFVKFSDVDSATEALNLVNGYNFKGKPIIIEYGRQNT